MRIALLLSGQPRFVKEVAPIILANVIGDYNVDTFCHFWFDDTLQSEPYKYGECNKGDWHKQRISADAIDEAIEAYHPVELVTEPSKSFTDSAVPFEESLNRYWYGAKEDPDPDNFRRTNINNTKPFGRDMSRVSFIWNQALFPYFMITSINKNMDKSDIVVTQLHELAPSIYDDWDAFDWSIYDFDPITGDYYIPVPNQLPSIDTLVLIPDEDVVIDVAGTFQFMFGYEVSDPDGTIKAVQYKIVNTETSEIISDYDENTTLFEEDVNYQSGFGYFQIYEYGSYSVSLKVFDDLDAFVEDVITFTCVQYTEVPPVAKISYESGLEDLGVFEESQILQSSDDYVDDNEYIVPYSEDGHEITLSSELSLSMLPYLVVPELTGELQAYWNVGDEGYEEEPSVEKVITLDEENYETTISLKIVDEIGLETETEEIWLIMEPPPEEEEEEEEETGDEQQWNANEDIGLDFSEDINDWIVNEDGSIDVYRDFIMNYDGEGGFFDIHLVPENPEHIANWGSWKRQGFWLEEYEPWGDDGEVGDIATYVNAFYDQEITLTNNMYSWFDTPSASWWANSTRFGGREFYYVFGIYLDGQNEPVVEIRINFRHNHDSDGTAYED